MNKFLFRPSPRSSFTLVELLVVMGIIGILAAVLIEAGGVAIRSAKRAKAANTATQIQTAALSYYTEYSVYPVGSATADGSSPASIGDTGTLNTASANGTAWGNLIEALCGNIKPSTGAAATQTAITNSRGIAFLSLKSTDVDTIDAPINPLPTGTEIYFNIAMDADYDGVLGVSPSTALNLPNFSASPFNATAQAGGGTSTAGVAVWANCNASTSLKNANFYVHTY